MTPETILLVEDERDIAFPLGRTLEREGYDVAWVDNGREAFDVVDEGPVPTGSWRSGASGSGSSRPTTRTDRQAVTGAAFVRTR